MEYEAPESEVGSCYKRRAGGICLLGSKTLRKEAIAHNRNTPDRSEIV